MLCVGQYVYDNLENDNVQILEILEIWGFVSYKVFNQSKGIVYLLSDKEISTKNLTSHLNEGYIRYVSVLCKIKNESSTGIISTLSRNIIPLPHQLYVLKRALANNNIRYILADEVGLGKTIEAGLIIKELKTRGLIKRTLIVCPKGLITQWNLEMSEKFDEEFSIILPEDFDAIRKVKKNDDVYSQFDQVISPMDSIKPLEKRIGWDNSKIEKYNDERINSIVNSGWDLIIIDEAHRIAGSSGEVARYKLGSLLSKASPYILLLTATPHNGKTEPFLRLIRLIDEKAFPSYKAIVKELVSPYIIRTEKRNAINNQGERLFKDRITRIVNLTWDERHSLQKELYEMVTDYVSKNYSKALRNRSKNISFVFLLIMMQRLVTSSTSAIRLSLEKRLTILKEKDFKYKLLTNEEFIEMDIEETQDDILSAISIETDEEISHISKIITLARQAEYQYRDVKVEPLLTIIEDLYSKNINQKVIIFTEFVATQNYIKELLESRKYRVSILNGSMNIVERNLVLAEFQFKTDILISTDAGGEGLNLQFCNCVINYDLPWNPMKIEQRIGRVDRIGQQQDAIIYNFVLADTVENRVRNILEEKLHVILKELGVDKYSDVLDNEEIGLNFTDAYMNSIMNPSDLNKETDSIEEEVKKQVQNAIRFLDLVSEEKDLLAYVKNESSFDLTKSLYQMMENFYCSINTKKLPKKIYNMTDPEILEHLNKDIHQNLENNIISLTMNDFPNEKGYFMLWQISVKNDKTGKLIVPIFINSEFILRPIAGKKIWDELVNENRKITVTACDKIDAKVLSNLQLLSREYSYETFLKIKNRIEKEIEDSYAKQIYALNLRIEAATNIGIKNIRIHKLNELEDYRKIIEFDYKEKKSFSPDFKLITLVRME